MRLPCISSILALSTFLVLLKPQSVWAGCALNFDKMKHRRLEAIRGQILSKLGFSELPKEDPISPPSLEQLKLYNHTRDFVNEQARKKQQECEEREDHWYAQDIVTVYEHEPEIKDIYEEKNEKEANYFHFDLTKYSFRADQVMSATLRIHQAITPGPKETEQVVINDIIGSINKPGRSKETLHEFTMYLKKESWRSFDVTGTIRRWIDNPDQNLGMEMTLACKDRCNCDSPNPTITTNIEGATNILRKRAASSQHLLRGRGDRDVEIVYSERSRRGRGDRDLDDVPSTAEDEEETSNSMNHPHLVIMLRSVSDDSKGGHSRKKRSTNKRRRLDADYCLNQKASANCCLRELYIDFKKDLNWHWVVSPEGYMANFCAGSCPYMYSGDTMHYSILYMHRLNNPNASPSPCCTPKEYAPLTLMFQQDGKYRIRQLTDLLVVSCGCG